MNDEKGQLSGEYLLLIGSLITVFDDFSIFDR